MLSDVRFAIRMLGSHPGFTAVAVLTLAAGIGLNSAIFTLFNSMLLKPMPVHEPSRLVWIASSSVKPDGPQGNVTYPDFAAIRDTRDVFSGAFAFTETTLSVSASGQALHVNGQLVSGEMFEVLGVRMRLGRAFAAEEDRVPGVHSVAVIGYGLWQRLFGGDPAAVGQTIVINGHAATIIGVAPNGFAGPELMAPTDIWVPLMMHRTALPDVGAPFSPRSWWLKVVGRLADGVTIRQAEARLTALGRAMEAAEPGSHGGVTMRAAAFHGTDPQNRAQVLPLSALLMGLTLTVLLIACANVAGLLLSRAAGRQREIGIRLAVGATPVVLVRQLLAESLLMAVVAGALGLLLGMWGTDLIVRLIDVPVQLNVSPDWRVALFTLCIAVAAGLAFGILPAVRSAGQDVLHALRGDRTGDATPRSSFLQRSIVIGQLAVALVLLVGAGLFVRALAQAWRTDTGFEYVDRVAVTLDLRLQNYSETRAATFYEQALERVRALPGVHDATLAQAVPFGGRVFVHSLSVPEQPVDPNRRPDRASVNSVWTGFFSTLRIPLVRGRDFAAGDLKAVPDVAIISETTARRYWPDGDPIGRRLSIGKPEGPYLTVVGVARDVLIDEFTERPWPAVYVPHRKTASNATILVWSSRPAAEAIRDIEQTVRALDRNLPIVTARPLSQYVAERMDGERALSSLLAACGTLALALAAMGLYGVMAYAVARRTREIGVRVALGAAERDVLRLFVADGLRIGAWGVAWGVLPAIALTYVLRGELVGIGFADPPTLAAAAGILVVATLLAACLPALRATHVDPVVALRSE